MAANETLARLSKGLESLNEFNKANLAAAVQANSILLKGLVELSKEVFTITQASFKNATGAGETLKGVKSVSAGIELATDSAKAGYDKFLFNAGKVSELSNKLAKDALAPVAARLDAVIAQVANKPAEATEEKKAA